MNSSINNYRLVKILLLVLTIFISFQNLAQNQKIHITGSLPDVQGGSVFMYSYHINEPLKNGKFDIWLDSVNEGEYTIAILYPNKDSSIIFRNEQGKIITKKNNHPTIGFSKRFYINPQQATKYKIEPSKKITIKMLDHFGYTDKYRTDLFRLKIISGSEDGNLYEKLDCLKDYYNGLEHCKILDSLYKIGNSNDKIYDDFEKKARTLNYQNNYANFLSGEKDIISKHLESPVAPLFILNIDSSHLVQNLPDYEQMLNKMSGRAIKSSYYERALKSIENLQNNTVFKDGDILPLPTGKTPQLKKLQYTFSDYKYTLVNFWASWCAACRAENPLWNKVLEKFRKQGFTILGVSLDENLIPWRNAIAKDDLKNWLHLSDLESAWTCSNVLKYRIRQIPYNVLLDIQGHVVKRNITPQDAEKFLTTRLSN